MITKAARAVLPIWKKTPNRTLCRDAGLPTAEDALEKAGARMALHIKHCPKRTPPRGLRGAGHAPKRAGYEDTLPAADANADSGPITAGTPPEEASTTTTLNPGVPDQPNERPLERRRSEGLHRLVPQTRTAGHCGLYGRVKGSGRNRLRLCHHRPTNDTTRATGLGSLDATAEVYDAEALGALHGLEKTIEVAPPTPGYTSASTTRQLSGGYGPQRSCRHSGSSRDSAN